MEKEQNSMTEELESQALVVNILKEMGCDPVVKNDETKITLEVMFQGSLFNMVFWRQIIFVDNGYWSTIKVDDPDWPLVREAINVTNCQFGPTTIWTHPTEDGDIFFLSHREMVLNPAYPHLNVYVGYVLESFFTASNSIRENINRMKLDVGQDAPNQHRPVGFDTTNQQ